MLTGDEAHPNPMLPLLAPVRTTEYSAATPSTGLDSSRLAVDLPPLSFKSPEDDTRPPIHFDGFDVSEEWASGPLTDGGRRGGIGSLHLERENHLDRGNGQAFRWRPTQILHLIFSSRCWGSLIPAIFRRPIEAFPARLACVSVSLWLGPWRRTSEVLIRGPQGTADLPNGRAGGSSWS